MCKYKDRKVLFCVEKQGVRPGEGAVSAMTIGKGFGQLLGVGHAFEFDVSIVLPTRWKKIYSFLENNGVSDVRAEIKEKKLFGKTLEDKELNTFRERYIEIVSFSYESEEKRLFGNLAQETKHNK